MEENNVTKKGSKKFIIIGVVVLIAIIAVIALMSGAFSKKVTYKLGDSVESDILKVTLNKAQLAFALENTNGDKYVTPREYDANKDARNPFVAAKGHTLVAFTFTLENLDRSSIDIGGTFNPTFTSVKYNGKKYTDKAAFKAESVDGIEWKSYSSTNILLQAAEKTMYRAYIDIPVNAENLEDTFELNFYIPNSNGKKEEFTFVVTKEDRDNQVEEEISLDLAIKYFTKTKGREYFAKHYNEYEVVKGSEITNVVLRKKWNIEEIDNGIYVGTFTFEQSGRIYERSDNGYAVGYVNNRTWNVGGDTLILTWSGKSVNTSSCEMRKVKDGVYLLISEGKPYMLMK